MKKNVLTAFCCLGLSIALNAQNGWLPPDYFTSNTNLCDQSPWRLVFTDDFDGNQINTSKWITYGSYPGMDGGDNEHWNNARSGGEHSFIFRDYNVVVSNGTCKLLMRRETNSWICTSCDSPILYRRHATAGMIGTHRNLPDLTDIAYNTGRLEARIKFPTFYGSWCAFWTWHGLGVNEIDVAETWGGSSFFLGEQRRNKYGTHAWWPATNPDIPNPYNLPGNAIMGGLKFPGQEWYNFLIYGTLHRQEEWHVYTCEWEDNIIKFYLDGAAVNAYWKYIINQGYPYNGHNYVFNIGSGCTPQPLTAYYTNFGFPYNTHSASQVLLWGRVDHNIGLNSADIAAGKDSVMHPGILGQMEIDYVKIYQRHPESDNHTDLCDLGQAPPVITGPDFVCYGNDVTFTVTNPVPNGTFNTWNYGSPLTQTGTANNSSITLSASGLTPYNNGVIQYKYTVPGCPYQKVVSKYVYCNLRPNIGPYQIYMVNTNHGDGLRQLQFFEPSYYPNYENGPYKPTYEWNIDVADGNDSCAGPQHYRLFGQFASTPFVEDQANKNYCVNWKVKITDPQNNIVEKSGMRDLRTPLYQQAGDSSVVYFDALITDPDAYELSVYNRVKQITVSEDEAKDKLFTDNMIEKIRVEELAPYLNISPQVISRFAAKRIDKTTVLETKLYPNPASENLSILPGDKYVDNFPMYIGVYDLSGKLQKQETVSYNIGKVIDLSIGKLADAIYIIELKQGDIIERHKMIKTAGK